MPPHIEGEVLSRIEFVLPKNVLKTAYNLLPGLGATFVSTNLLKKTATRIKLFKRNDDAVSINCTVTALRAEELQQPQHIMIDQVKPREDVVETALGPGDSLQAFLPVAGNQSGSELSDHVTIARVHEETLPVVAPGSRIPDSLLAHDDLASPEKVPPSGVSAPQQEPIAEEVVNQDVCQPEKTVQSLENTEEQEQMSEKGILNVQSTAPRAKIRSPNSQNESQSEVAVETTTVNECASDTVVTPVKKHLLKRYKQKSGNSQGSKARVSTTSKSSGSSPETLSSKRPKRTSHLPARYSADTVVIGKLPSQMEADTGKTEVSDDGTKREDVETLNADNAQDVGETTSAPRKKRRRNFQDAENEQPKAKKERTAECPICAARMREYEHVFDHVKKQHANHKNSAHHLNELKEKMKVTCHLCGKEVARASSLKSHMETMHTVQNEARCPDCDAILKSKRHLETHVKRCHLTTIRTHLCHLCPAKFKMKQYLAIHLQNVHTDASRTDFKCDQCPKTFNTERYLKTHKLRVHGPKKFSCSHCGMGFSEPPNLRRHVKLIHEAPKQKRHFCPLCAKGFTLKSNLKEHVQTIHLGKYPFQCGLCSEGFSRRKQLEIHRSESHRLGAACFKQTRAPGTSFLAVVPQNPAQMIEIHGDGPNIFTVHAVAQDPAQPPDINPSGVPVTLGMENQIQAVEAVQAVENAVVGHHVELPAETDNTLQDGSTVTVQAEETPPGVTGDDSVQVCIVATPEMLEAFGIKEGPGNDEAPS